MKTRLGLVLAGVLAVSGVASASLITTNAYTDGNAVTWTGTVSMISNTDANLDADVEYVVNKRVLHDGNLQFEYNYQITSNGLLPITLVYVNMILSNEAEDIGSYQIDVGDEAPTSEFFTVTPYAANWTFDNLTDGDVSYGLSYWSVNEPLWKFGVVQDGGAVAGALLPSPSDKIPEPASVAALAIGALALVGRRRRRQTGGPHKHG